MKGGTRRRTITKKKKKKGTQVRMLDSTWTEVSSVCCRKCQSGGCDHKVVVVTQSGGCDTKWWLWL